MPKIIGKGRYATETYPETGRTVGVNTIYLKTICDAASTANISDLSTVNVIQDGVTLSAGKRLFIPNQSSTSQNGIYTLGIVVAGFAPLTKSGDADEAADFAFGALVSVSMGSFYAGTLWLLSSPPPTTIGIDPLIFTQIGRDPTVGVPNKSEAVDIAVADFPFTIVTTGIRIGGSGDMYAKLRDDSVFRLYVVTAGETVDGDFVAVQKAGTTATNMIGLTRT